MPTPVQLLGYLPLSLKYDAKILRALNRFHPNSDNITVWAVWKMFELSETNRQVSLQDEAPGTELKILP